jgi:hypothetical protein
MKQIFTFLTIVILSTYSCQSKTDFKIVNNIISEKEFRKKEIEIKSKMDSIFYKDDIYTVFKQCHGEWGGIIVFENNETKKKFASISTCPISVQKMNNKYIVTNTLAHLSGVSYILEIENPEKLDTYNEKFNKNTSENGTKKILDAFGTLTLTSFVYNNQLLFITTDFKKTYLSRINNSKFENLLEIKNEGIWCYNPETINYKDHKYIFFVNHENKGYFDIFQNKIELNYVK